MRYDNWIREVAGEVADLKRQVEQLAGRSARITPARQTRLAITVADPDSSQYPKAPANTFHIVFVDGSYIETQGWQDHTLANRQSTDNPIAVAHGLGLNCYADEGSLVDVFWHNGQWWFITQCLPTGLQLAEDHPGRGIVFNVWVGTRNPVTDGFDYDKSTTYKAIDWRHGVPEPAKCATGDGYWFPSKTHGKILYVNSLDCTTPGCAGSS